MRVAIVHDYLTQLGGAEKVLEEILKLYPQAPVYTLAYNPLTMNGKFASADIRSSFIQKLPGGVKNYQYYLPLMPRAIESFDLTSYDLIISSASSFAKGVIKNESATHVCYCHTPTRYMWGGVTEHIDQLPYSWPLRRAAALAVKKMKRWDNLASQRPDVLLANSEVIRQKIAKYYKRQAAVIYPPVDVNFFSVSDRPGSYFLAGGRLVWYKRFDVIVKAFNRTKLPLKIFGTGPDFKKLRAMSRPNIEWLGFVDDKTLANLYGEALAYIHPQEEDFGITAVEAMAAGRPVIAFNAGGAVETVVNGQTGYYIDEQSWEALGDAVIRFRPESYSAAACRQQAEKFSVANFQENFKKVIAEIIQQRKPV
jgi:glycosyltransferase involved in cell wall biosynthesis